MIQKNVFKKHQFIGGLKHHSSRKNGNNDGRQIELFMLSDAFIIKPNGRTPRIANYYLKRFFEREK